MPNVGPATATITSTTGPGQAVTAQVFNNVTGFRVDFMKNTISIDWNATGQVPTTSILDYSAITTFTWSISGGASTLTIS